MKTFILSSLAAVALFVSGTSMADGFEGSTIKCGDHWLNARINVEWPQSTIELGGDSNPLYTTMDSSTLTYPTKIDGRTVYMFFFRALDGIPVDISLESTDGRTATGSLWIGDREVSIDCRITQPDNN
jgi:hypothetical protein